MVNPILILMTTEHRARTLTPDLLHRLEALGPVVIAPDGDPRAPAARQALTEAGVVMTGTGTHRLDDDVLDGAPHLRAIVHAAGTLRPIVTEDVYDRGIVLSSQASANALPVAEYTLAMVLLELKGVPLAAQAYATARGEVDVDALLADHGAYRRRVGIISASAIGRRVIELLRPFDVETCVYDPYLSAEDAERIGTRLLPLEDVMRTSDVVSLHAPLLPETIGMIGAAELARLRDGAVFINTARGALVDQAALVSELRRGRIRAVIDVTDPEVPPPDSGLWGCPNLVLTPHVAGSRGRELVRIGAQAVEEVERFCTGQPLQHSVPRERFAITA